MSVHHLLGELLDPPDGLAGAVLESGSVNQLVQVDRGLNGHNLLLGALGSLLACLDHGVSPYKVTNTVCDTGYLEN